MSLDVDAHIDTQVDGFLIGKTELFSQLVDAQILSQFKFSLSFPWRSASES